MVLLTTLLFGLLPASPPSTAAPFFIDSADPNESVDCFTDVPDPVTLTADDNGSQVEVSPNDVVSGDACSGGTVTRTWTITNGDGTASEEQIITFGAAAPSIGNFNFPATTTVSCVDATDVNSPDNYNAWLSNVTFAVQSNSTAGCSAITSFYNDGPADVEGFDCNNGPILVTFTVEDDCGNTDDVSFTYEITDDVDPVIVGVGSDVTISCDDPIPPMPTVTVEDCDENPMLSFQEVNNQVFDGSCGEYEYEIIWTWTATDACMNSSVETMTIQVQDNEAPDFNRPSNENINCTEDWEDLSITGEPFDLSDNCTPVDDLDITYTDVIVFQPDCNFNFNVRRTWRVTDACGNTNAKVQNIFVGDNQSPIFTDPVDSVTVNCEDVFNLAITGEPTNITDNCTDNPNTSYEDEIVEQTCGGTYELIRTWRIFDDCGNDEFVEQYITVIDTTGPVFITPPSDLMATCNNEDFTDETFNLWVISMAGAQAVDACTPDNELTYEIYVSGTTEYPLLPPFSCDLEGQVVRAMDVDVIVTDNCGNRTVETVSFRQVDTQAPNVFDCPENQIIPTDPGQCFANVALEPPTITDQCVTGQPFSHRTTAEADITSDALPGEAGSTPVNTVVLNFPILVDLPVNALFPSDLTITLENVDAEGGDEFFRIIGEDGTDLGVTNRSNVQCANSVTVIEIPRLEFNRWAVDGTVTITLEPNIPDGQSGTFAINDLCAGGSRVLGELITPIRRLSPLVYEIIIDDEAPVVVDPVDTYFTVLPEGMHEVTYRVTDCAGNSDGCTFTITVEDREPPVVFCPEDIEIFLAEDSCTATIDVDLPVAAEDNCSIYEETTLTVPAASEDRLFRFDFDPNLNSFQARDILADFSTIPPFVFDTVEIRVRFRGDFNTNDAILDVSTNDGTLLGSSIVGDADCDTEGQLLIRIPSEDFNAMVNNGNFGLRLEPRTITVPPGQPGDGVNPCNNTVTEQGDNDGVSYAYAELTYRVLRPVYFSTGATVTGPTMTTIEEPQPRITFNQGVTDFFYVIEDPSGNRDSCAFAVTVTDTISPVVNCQSTTVFVDPSGLAPGVLTPEDVVTESMDNCGIVESTVFPNSFDCDEVGGSVNATVTVADASGNESSCTVLVAIASSLPQPTANSGFCGGDTLFLFANPPTVAQPNQVIYTYRWFNPDDLLISTEENPVITGIDDEDDGPYRVEITGLTGCTASAVVNVSVEGIPPAPSLAAPQSVCIGEDIPLSAVTNYSGTVVYEWYEGLPGSGALIGTSPAPSFSVPAPHGNNGRSFYLVAVVNGCPSNPSVATTVTTVTRPTVSVVSDSLSGCENQSIFLRAETVSNVIYSWEGPNGFAATGQAVELSDLGPADAGTYYLTAIRNEGCFSAVDSLVLEVIDATPVTTLSSNGPVCAGTELLLTAADDDADSYTFLSPSGGQFLTDTSTLVINSATMSEQGIWRVIVRDGACPSLPSEPIMVSVNQPPVAQTMILPDPVCTGNDLILQGSSNQSGSTYLWSGPNGFASNLVAPTITDVDMNDAGDYTLTVTGPAGCIDTEVMTVEVLPGIAIAGIEATNEDCLVGGETVGLIALVNPLDTNGTYTYEWSGPMGISGNSDTLFIPDVSAQNSGNYTVQITNEAGCVSPLANYTVDLQFAPATPMQPTTADGEIGYCIGNDFRLFTTDYGPQTTYFWQLPDGATITSDTNSITLNAFDENFAGNYRVRVVRNGCTSTFSEPIELLITDFPNLTASTNTPVCAGSAISLLATDLPNATYSWRGPNNFSSSLAAPMINSADPDVHNGIYSVVAKIGGCLSDTMRTEVVVQPKPSVPVGVPQSPLCISDVDALLELTVNENTATPGATYRWYTENGTVPVGDSTTDLTLPLTDFSLFPAGGMTSFFVQAELDGCFSELSNVLNVRLDIALENAADAGPDTTICEGLYLLEAAPPAVGSGSWELIEGGGEVFIANPDARSTAVSGMSEFGGPYRFVWSLSNGTCTEYSRDTVTINVTNGEDAFAGEDILACLGLEATLGAIPVQEPSSEGRWSQNLAQEILGVVIVDETDPNTLITGLQPDNVYSFTWTVTSDCGVKSDVVLVNVSDPGPDAGMDEIVCNEDRMVVLAATEPTIGSSGRWSTVDPNLTIDDPESPTSMAGNLLVGENLFIWEVDSGFCGFGSADTLIVEYKEPPLLNDDEVAVPFQGMVEFDPLQNDEIPAGSTVQFPEQPAVGELSTSGGVYSYQAPANFAGTVQLVYLVLSDGCTTSSATITFRVGENADCAPPNIFTPNEDGVNDFFIVPCLLNIDDFPESQVTIFNQWGDEVYKSGQPYQGDWDGRFNGEPLPVGTYFFLVEFGAGQEPLSGHVRIQR